MAEQLFAQGGGDLSHIKLKKLTLEQIRQIDDLLNGVGEYGEVILVIENTRLKYINTMESHKVKHVMDEQKRRKV